MHRSRTGLVLIDHPDPAGMVFCVVPVQTGDDFEREALTWDD
jgi:hypothetical protein